MKIFCRISKTFWGEFLKGTKKDSNWLGTSFGAFAIEREETTGKNKK